MKKSLCFLAWCLLVKFSQKLHLFCSSEVEKNSDGRTFAIMIAVATVILKLFGLRNHSGLNYIIEKHGSYVSKDKSMRSRFISKPKKVNLSRHFDFYKTFLRRTQKRVSLIFGVSRDAKSKIQWKPINVNYKLFFMTDNSQWSPLCPSVLFILYRV